MRSEDGQDPRDDEATAASAEEATGSVTISGAHRAGEEPAGPEAEDLLGDAEDWGVATSDATAEPTELPHWTEAPTGQVPAVLAEEGAGTGEDPWAALPPPTWREEEADWTAEEASFEPSMLADQRDAGDGLEGEATGEVPAFHDDDPFSELPGGEATASPSAEAPAAGEAEAAAPQTRAERRGAHAGGRRRAPRPPGPRATEPVPAGAATGPRDMRVAVLTGMVLAFLVLVTFNLGTILAGLLVTIVVLAATAEAYAVLRRVGERPATLLGLVATFALLVAVYNRGEVAYPLLTVLLVAATLLWFLVGVERANPVRGTATTLFVFGWVGIFGSYAMLLLNPDHFPDRHGLAFLLGAIICTVANDVAALAAGSSLGRRPLAPSISPAKSWEGAIGGAMASLLAGLFVGAAIHPWSIGAGIVLGLVVGIVAPLGDLAESMLKRAMNLKDTSTVLPGHGGILDRVDGLLFVLPATYYVVRAFNLG